MTKAHVVVAAVAACVVALGGCPSDKDSDDERVKLGADAGDHADAGSESPDSGGGAEPDKDAGAVTADSSAPEHDAATNSAGASYPAELGFDLDGTWYPQDANKASCGVTENVNGTTYYANQWGVSDKGAAVFYFSFNGGIPAAGDYPAGMADPLTGIPAKGEVSIRINDARDMSGYWDTDGMGGTVTVIEAAGGALDVLWHDVTFVRGAGSIVFAPGETIVSREGWQTCKSK